MIIFTIAKQISQLTLACKSKKKKISLYICTFIKLSKTNTNLLIDVKQEWFILVLNLHEFPLFTIIVRRKEPQGSSSVIHFFSKH